jgi:hypothetical protein
MDLYRMRIQFRISNAECGSIPTQNNDFTLKIVTSKGWANYLDIDLVGEAAPGTEGPYAGEVMLTRPDTNRNIEVRESVAKMRQRRRENTGKLGFSWGKTKMC